MGKGVGLPPVLIVSPIHPWHGVLQVTVAGYVTCLPVRPVVVIRELDVAWVEVAVDGAGSEQISEPVSDLEEPRHCHVERRQRATSGMPQPVLQGAGAQRP